MSLKGGYEVLYINTVALAANNFQSNQAALLDNSTPLRLFEESSALYHGFHAGLEYVW